MAPLDVAYARIATNGVACLVQIAKRLRDPLTYLVALAGHQSWPAFDRAPVGVPFREFASVSEGLQSVPPSGAWRSMALVAHYSEGIPCVTLKVRFRSCRRVT